MAAFYLFVGDRFIEPDSVDTAHFPVSKESHNDNGLTIIGPMVDLQASGALLGRLRVGASSADRAAGPVPVPIIARW